MEMNFSRRALAVMLAVLFLLNCAPWARACGPSSIEPVFVFHESPDLPFAEFTRGKIGIVQPGFGRKTLVIAYRYLNGGSFNADEQESLVDALRGKAPEDEGAEALQAWVSARKEFLRADEKLPEIYAERRGGNYDFFPNCTKNAFEVATATLKERVASYGTEDRNVRDWMVAQDAVFQNCSGGAKIPDEIGTQGPPWLRKDRDYQIAAAEFYSLNFDQARQRFESIAADAESPWQETAHYLVARTLLRQASLTGDQAKKLKLYQRAEAVSQDLMGQSQKFYHAARKLLALVKYRLHPEERVGELARTLANQSGSETLRQDLIDYVWLLDRFEARIVEAERKRTEVLKPRSEEKPEPPFISAEVQARNEALQRGDLIHLGVAAKKADGTPDYANYVSLDFKYDASETEILQAFEMKLGRKLFDDEAKEIKERHTSSLELRQWLTSPNRKWDNGGLSQYEGDYDRSGDKLKLDQLPEFLRADDLSDWIFTLQTEDPGAYQHALAQWHDTDSHAWLVTALIKAKKTSPNLVGLIRDAERVGRDAPEFPTVAYALVRLRLALGRNEAARKLIDDVLAGAEDLLPISALNQFREQRARLSEGLSEFLKYAQRKPVAFYGYEGRLGSLKDLLRIGKASWDPEYVNQSRAEYEQEIEERYKDVLPWDDRFSFDEETVDILNWHFPLRSLIEASRDRAVPAYLQRELILAAWTRAILLGRDEVATRIVPEVLKAAPEMTPVLHPYLQARTSTEKHYAALFALLKFPNLSPFVTSGIPAFSTAEQLDYYLESAWWCRLPNTEYNTKGEEVARTIAPPGFLTREQLAGAERERSRLISIGDAKSYLGKQVLEWAQVAPEDPRVPEALFIAARANESYKYGCGGWEQDPETQKQVDAILRERYPTDPWTAKLPPLEPK